ncbi:protein of unknown function DUF2856 [Flyfo siphovirus Tbat2_3]|nr:protein of unknown function DUF2856 [Flyfo siphovirus Tbat2_3]
MPSPLNNGADSPRMCSAGTKEEVMANFARYWDMSQAGRIPPQSRNERMEGKAKQLEKKELEEIAMETASLPRFEITGPHLPHDYIDDRQKVRHGRFGAIIND